MPTSASSDVAPVMVRAPAAGWMRLVIVLSVFAFGVLGGAVVASVALGGAVIAFLIIAGTVIRTCR
jgi:hypothetical protein